MLGLDDQRRMTQTNQKWTEKVCYYIEQHQQHIYIHILSTPLSYLHVYFFYTFLHSNTAATYSTNTNKSTTCNDNKTGPRRPTAYDPNKSGPPPKPVHHQNLHHQKMVNQKVVVVVAKVVTVGKVGKVGKVGIANQVVQVLALALAYIVPMSPYTHALC